MTNNCKMEYDAPMVVRLQARVERGFAGSGSTTPEPTGNPGSTEGLTQYGTSYDGSDFD